ncbi:MAG: hydroxymethylbilane synthase [Draconibacterium sp.]|nr:hydroxymethylbilane synthase [Draconibacterium sp.]
MKKNIIRIGTRGSQLALYQANRTKKELSEKFPEIAIEIVIIKTKGDKILDVPLSKIGDKGLFTKEIETALIENKIDIAVHSLKDLPTQLPEGLKLGAVLARGEFRDALVSKDGRKLSELTPNDIIATSSLRRQANLLHLNKNFIIVDIRGNVNTRLKKMNDGYCDAMIMAAAGLQRLNFDSYITEILDTETMIPATCQGIIGIESRINDPDIDEILQEINDTLAQNASIVERAFLHSVEGGCQVPVGCFTEQNGGSVTITGFVAAVDGTEFLIDTETGLLADAEAVGISLGKKLIARGAGKILEKIRKP